MTILVQLLLATLAIIVIILVLLQRGKGGGLAGALGGAGGQSAFGTKAGDLFTKITVGVASVWIIVCIMTSIGASKFGPQIAPTDVSATQGGQPAVSPQPAAGAPAKNSSKGSAAAASKGSSGTASKGSESLKNPVPPPSPPTPTPLPPAKTSAAPPPATSAK
jgi:preprotein translocase subunit SecG